MKLKFKKHTSKPFFSLDKNIVGESINSKLNKITKYLKKINLIIYLLARLKMLRGL